MSNTGSPEGVEAHPLLDGPWYYRLELAPGVHTPGPLRGNVAATRELLARTTVAGARCLDVGTQEGLVPVLLSRRDAAEVLAYDRVLRSDKLDLVRSALGAGFSTTGGYRLAELPGRLAAEDIDPFDVVVFSGVLHHMLDPLGGLASVRGTVREGGICIVESPVVLSDEVALHFNSKARFTPTGFWFMTPASIDYLLRMLSLEPLAALFTRGRPAEPGKPAQGRVAVAARAVAEPVADSDDTFLGETRRDFDLAEFLDFERLRSDAEPVAFDADLPGVAREAGGIDVAATVAAGRPFKAGDELKQLELGALR